MLPWAFCADQHHLVWAEEYAIAFLAKDPPLLGTTLVAPRAHREQVTGDFPMAEYLWHVAPLPPGVPHHKQQRPGCARSIQPPPC
jgi:hypothetical protein